MVALVRTCDGDAFDVEIADLDPTTWLQRAAGGICTSTGGAAIAGRYIVSVEIPERV